MKQSSDQLCLKFRFISDSISCWTKPQLCVDQTVSFSLPSHRGSDASRASQLSSLFSLSWADAGKRGPSDVNLDGRLFPDIGVVSLQQSSETDVVTFEGYFGLGEAMS